MSLLGHDPEYECKGGCTAASNSPDYECATCENRRLWAEHEMCSYEGWLPEIDFLLERFKRDYFSEEMLLQFQTVLDLALNTHLLTNGWYRIKNE